MRWICGAMLMLLAAVVQGGEQKLGSYTLYYSTQNTVELSPEIARQYGIDRLPRVALLLVNIRDANGKAVVAAVSGKARNLLGQTQSLATRKIEEGAAISYIALFEISHLDTLSFDLDIRPENSTQLLELRFSQQFFVD